MKNATGFRRIANGKSLGMFLLAGMLVTAVPRAGRAQEVEVGSMAPSAKVHTLDGKEFDLGSYAGKTPAVIEFWATWCPVCAEL